MPDVTLKHPGLADGQTITVDEISVYHYKRSGWTPVSEKSDEPAARKKSEAK